MAKNAVVSGCILLLMSALVFADQAAWIEKTAAYKAGEMISPGQAIRKYCAPCGDAAWTELTVNQVEVKPVQESSYEILVNGEGVDLAYLYVEKNGRWVNFAILLGLKVADVPEFLPDPGVTPRIRTAEQVHPIGTRSLSGTDEKTSMK